MSEPPPPWGSKDMRGLEVADDAPPGKADGEEDHHGDDAAQQADGPPLALAHVIGAKEHRSGTRTVVREATHEVGEHAQQHGGCHGRSASGDAHSQEGAVHGGDMRGGAGEQVVGQEVHNAQDDERSDPGQAAHSAGHKGAEPGDEAQGVEVGGHHDQHGEPHQGVPCAFLVLDVVPGEDVGEEQEAQADESGDGGVEVDGAAGDPQSQDDEEHTDHELLAGLHGAHLGQLLLGKLGGLRGFFDLRRINDEDDDGDHDQTDQTGNERGDCPAEPVDVNAAKGGGQRSRQRVGGHGSEEHAGGDHIGLEGGDMQVRADLALGAVVRLGTKDVGECLDDGEDNATGAGRVGRHSGGQHQVGEDEGIGKTQRLLAELAHKCISDAAAQAGLDETAANKERDNDQPDGGVVETGKSVGDVTGAGAIAQKTGEHDDGQLKDAHGTHGDGLQDEAHDGGHEDGQQVPAVGGDGLRRDAVEALDVAAVVHQVCRDGDEPHKRTNTQGDDQKRPIDTFTLRLAFFGDGCLGLGTKAFCLCHNRSPLS